MAGVTRVAGRRVAACLLAGPLLVACSLVPSAADHPIEWHFPATAASTQLPILACLAGDAPVADPRCQRVTDAFAWREVRAGLGQVAAGWPEGFADFEHEVVVVVVLPPAVVAATGQVIVAEEEGVDVVTLAQASAAPSSTTLRTAVCALRLPRRQAQLAVVHRVTGPAPRERTLQVFPGF